MNLNTPPHGECVQQYTNHGAKVVLIRKVKLSQQWKSGMYAIPNEVIIMESVTEVGNNVCLTDRLKDYESRIEFLEEKLELSEDLIEVGLRDLERARHCIHDLVERNAKMKAGMSVREKMKKDYERGEIMVEHYWILRISLYSSLFFFLSGSGEYFLASAFFIWLALEMNVTA